MDGITTILTYMKRGDFTDRPVAATLDALIHPNALAFYSAEDTSVLYRLNRTTVAWDIVASGPASSTFLGLTDVDPDSSFAADDLFKWDGAALVNISPADLLGLIGAAAAPSGTANTPLFDDGAGGFTNGTRSGDTLQVATVDGAKTAGNLLAFDADGNAVDSGIASVGVGGGDVTGPGSGSVVGNLPVFDGINSLDDSGIAASDVLVVAGAGTDYIAPNGVGLAFNLIFAIEQAMTNAEEPYRFIPPACSFPSGGAGSSGTAGTAATGSTTITAKKNGSAFATFVWSAAGTVAVVTIGSTTGFNGSSDVFTLEGQATADATLAKIGINLAGARA